MSWKDTWNAQRNYYREYGQEISKRNLKLMRTVCYAGIILFTAYYIVTLLFFPAKGISLLYGLVVPFLILFAWEICRLLKKDSVSIKRTQILTLLMYSMIMIYMIIMSTIPHPELNAVYYPLFLLLAPAMFLLPIHQQFLINAGSFVIFYICVVNIKPKALWSHDLFESATALVLSFIMMLLMMQLRVQGENLKDQYYRLSRQDGLTGLLNKTTGTKLGRDYVENEIFDEPYALVILDIDNFKNINDTYGHEKGDEILAYAGALLARTFRRDDIVCRYGGDEFLIVMKRMLREHAEKKIIELRNVMQESNQEIKITCSIGIYIGTCGTKNFETAVKYADDMLYAVKRNGKNHYLFSDEVKP